MDGEVVEDIEKGDVVMIGDDVVDDIQGALDVGLEAVLVRTGKYITGDEQKVVGGSRQQLPLLVSNDFAAAVEAMEKEGLM